MCEGLHLPRRTGYRWQHPALAQAPKLSGPPRTWSLAEKAVVRETLNSERFQDQAPREIYATRLDEQRDLGHGRTMYRILAENKEIRERRDQLRHPAYTQPELLATGPNPVWSWDMTKLLGPVKWTYFYLYVILDIFSRYVVGGWLAERESSELAERLIGESCAKQNIAPEQITLPADNGGPRIAHTVSPLMVTLGVTESHSRPHVSDDNPYSEAQFKTMKYGPDYPERFADETRALTWARGFFAWYNHAHHHTALGLMTPAAVHSGRAAPLWDTRPQVLQAAYRIHPERFVKGRPLPPALPTAAWINPPKEQPAGALTQVTAPAPTGVDTDDLH